MGTSLLRSDVCIVNDIEKCAWVSPFPMLAISQPCDYNLNTTEKVPNTLVLRGNSVSTLQNSPYNPTAMICQRFYNSTHEYKRLICTFLCNTWFGKCHFHAMIQYLTLGNSLHNLRKVNLYPFPMFLGSCNYRNSIYGSVLTHTSW